MFELSSGSYIKAVSLFLGIPVIIFFLGFFNLAAGLSASAVFIAASFFLFKDSGRDGLDQKKVKIPLRFLVILIITALITSVFTGVGEYVWTTDDHAFRRAILRDLIDYDWPLIFDPSTQTNPDVAAKLAPLGNYMFIYYLLYWLPAALVGKAAGFGAANVFLVIYNSAGIFLTMLGMALYIRRASYSVLFTYLCFSGLDVIPYMIRTGLGMGMYWGFEGYVGHMSMISNMYSLMNVYNQCVPCWLIVTVIMLSQNGRSLGYWGSLLFAYSPWAVFGLIPIAAAKIIAGKKAKDLFTVCNILTPVLFISVFGIYYKANSVATGVSGFTWTFFVRDGRPATDFLISYLIMISVEVLPFVLLLYKRMHKNYMFWTAVGTLLVLPVYKISEQNDFVMRGSMPALFILCIFLAQKISEISAERILKRRKQEKWPAKALVRIALGCLIIAGTLYIPWNMFAVVLSSTIAPYLGIDASSVPRLENKIYSFGNINDDSYTDRIKEQFFVYDYENTVYYRYLARK